LQLDGSTKVYDSGLPGFWTLKLDDCDVSQILAFIRMVFNDGNIWEELLKTVSLHGKNRDEDI
jgi:hypothetical protein